MVYLPGAPPAVALARPAVEAIVRLPNLLVADGRQVRALREVLPEGPVGVLVGPPLPRAVREAEVGVRTISWTILLNKPSPIVFDSLELTGLSAEEFRL